MLNIDKYSKFKKTRQTNKKKCYKKVFKHLLSEVENIMLQEVDFLVFEVEPFMIGEIDYNMLECVNYLIEKIKKDKNFKLILEQIDFFEPNILYVKWDLNKI